MLGGFRCSVVPVWGQLEPWGRTHPHPAAGECPGEGAELGLVFPWILPPSWQDDPLSHTGQPVPACSDSALVVQGLFPGLSLIYSQRSWIFIKVEVSSLPSQIPLMYFSSGLFIAFH